MTLRKLSYNDLLGLTGSKIPKHYDLLIVLNI